jgi:predicted nucleic acid-binding protein
MDLIADTTFLVGLWRRQSWAVDFAQRHRQRILGVPWIVLGEFWHGARRAQHEDEVVRKFLGTGMPICDAAPVVPVYASICCQAQEDGFYTTIGQNDLWIAATALHYALPLVTRNRRHFDRIRGLRIEVLCDGTTARQGEG